MEAQQKPNQPTTAQPQKAIQMDALNPAAPVNSQQSEHQHKARRIRGGGAGRDCFIGLIECFICFECCKDCCECFADIICKPLPCHFTAADVSINCILGCPCEMCC
ncbi:hypothetical protein BJV74DRAFT_870274 [Russula compacta]|nr:hypothetical protein BJV74DRAFT_870274 [Russula compacta]